MKSETYQKRPGFRRRLGTGARSALFTLLLFSAGGATAVRAADNPPPLNVHDITDTRYFELKAGIHKGSEEFLKALKEGGGMDTEEKKQWQEKICQEAADLKELKEKHDKALKAAAEQKAGKMGAKPGGPGDGQKAQSLVEVTEPLPNLDGDILTLIYGLFNPSTGAPIFDPAIAAVRYDVYSDYSTDLMTFIGMSADGANGFPMDYTVSGFEPLIIATPLDANGDRFLIPGQNGEDLARAGLSIIQGCDNCVPDGGVGTFPLAAGAAMLCVAMGKKRRKQILGGD